MDKNEIIRKLSTSAKLYSRNLENKNILFVYKDKSEICSFETAFLARNYQHLTGIYLTGNTSSTLFYKSCLNGKVSPQDFDINEDGTTELKLDVLSGMMNIHNKAKMIGDFNSPNAFVIPDKIIGTVYACMGFVFDDDSGYYVPNTIRKEDIRDITIKPQKQIICTLVKEITDSHYTEFSYISKNIKYPNEVLYAKLAAHNSKINLQN